MATGQSNIQALLQRLSGVQTAAQGSVPSAVNNGNPNTVYNNAMPVGTQNNPWVQYNPVSGTGGYLPPATNALGQWLINPGPIPAAGSGIDWSQMIQDIAGPMLPTWNPQTSLPPTPPPGTTPPPTTNPPPVNTGGPLPPQIVSGGHTRPGRGGCVVLETFVDGKEGRAGTIKKRDLMVTIDPRNMVKGVDVVTYAETKPMPCVRIRTESGIELECSTTAPIADSKGNQVLAPNLKGVAILVMDNDEPRVEFVVDVEDIGNRLVRHITCGNKFFLAGKERGRYILHHNSKFSGFGLKEVDKVKDGNPDWMFSTGGGDYASQFGAEGAGGGSFQAPLTSAPAPDPFSPEGASQLTSLTNPLMVNSLIGQLTASMQTMGFSTDPTVISSMSAADAGKIVSSNEGFFSNLADKLGSSKVGVNAGQAMDFIKQHPVLSIFTFLTGGPIALGIKMAQYAARTPDK